MSDLVAVIQSQYLAALAMLKQAVQQCPEALWHADSQKNKFWHTAYHTLFYTHLYLQTAEEDFTPWDKHRDDVTSLRVDEQASPTPYSKEDILAYLAFCEQQVRDLVGTIDLEAESGFSWLPFNKLELQFYNIRHIQHHAGELYQQLLEESIDVGWVGAVPSP
jgi:hypothetical protein